MISLKNQIKSPFGVIWRKTGLASSDHQYRMTCYIWEGCLLLIMSTYGGQIVRKEYVSPDGLYFFKEHKLLKHMGVEVDENIVIEETRRTLVQQTQDI